MKLSTPLFTFFLFLVAARNFAAVSYHVEDEAQLFSPNAVATAERLIEEISQGTDPHKEILVKTVSHLPSESSPKAEAENLFRTRRLGGVLLYIVKTPHRLVVTVGRQTELKFHNKDEVRQAILTDFKRNDYDAGLMAGLNILRRDLLSEFPAGVPHRSRQVASPPYAFRDQTQNSTERSGSSGGWIMPLGLALLLVFLMWRLMRRRRSEVTQFPMNPPPSGGYAPGGDGFGRGLMGGLLGGLGASWLYDRFMRPRYHDTGFENGTETRSDLGGGVADLPPNDNGDIGSSAEGSWDSTNTSSDSGGASDFSSSGFDSGGGDGGGGGDW